MSTRPLNRMENGHTTGTELPEWQQQVGDYQRAVIEAVRENPVAATLIVFGVGFSIGTTIGALLDDPRDRRRQHLAKSLGRRMLNSVNDYLPDRSYFT
ncbi:MAG: hypothetical protein KDA52_12360 [Planctomycetaceae bacterium]|nr:hypothetical protein [Planctomycetaceae bacterium]